MMNAEELAKKIEGFVSTLPEVNASVLLEEAPTTVCVEFDDGTTFDIVVEEL